MIGPVVMGRSNIPVEHLSRIGSVGMGSGNLPVTHISQCYVRRLHLISDT